MTRQKLILSVCAVLITVLLVLGSLLLFKYPGETTETTLDKTLLSNANSPGLDIKNEQNESVHVASAATIAAFVDGLASRDDTFWWAVRVFLIICGIGLCFLLCFSGLTAKVYHDEQGEWEYADHRGRLHYEESSWFSSIMWTIFTIVAVFYFWALVTTPHHVTPVTQHKVNKKFNAVGAGKFSDGFINLLERLNSNSADTEMQYLRKVIDETDQHVIENLIVNCTNSDFMSLVSFAFDTNSYQEDEGHLSEPVEIVKEHFEGELPQRIESTGNEFNFEKAKDRLVLARCKGPEDAIDVYKNATFSLSHIKVDDNIHYFVDYQNQYYMVAYGDMRAALIVAIITNNACREHSIAKAGPVLVRDIQKALSLFAPTESCSFTALQQKASDGNERFIDVIQAGLMTVSVAQKNQMKNQMKSQTAVPSGSERITKSDAEGVKYYRLTAKRDDILLMYSSIVARNILPLEIASTPSAVMIAAKMQYILSVPNIGFHIPGSGVGKVASRPPSEDECKEILVLTKKIY